MARALISVTGAATDTDIIAAPTNGTAIRVLRIHFTVSAAATVSVTNGADGATTRLIYGDFAANGGFAGDPVAFGSGNVMPFAVCSGNTALKITNSAGNLKGCVEYDQV